MNGVRGEVVRWEGVRGVRREGVCGYEKNE